MKVTFKFIVVILILILGDNVYCQTSENSGNEGKDAEINLTEKSPLEAEQNLPRRIDLLNRIVLNKHSSYSNLNKSLTFENPILFNEDFEGYEPEKFHEDFKASNIVTRSRYIPNSRYYERPGTDSFDNAINPENFESWWCTGFLSGLKIRLNK